MELFLNGILLSWVRLRCSFCVKMYRHCAVGIISRRMTVIVSCVPSEMVSRSQRGDNESTTRRHRVSGMLHSRYFNHCLFTTRIGLWSIIENLLNHMLIIMVL